MVLRKAVRNPQHFSVYKGLSLRLNGDVGRKEFFMDEIRDAVPRLLTEEQLERILQAPDPETHAGLRDRAVLEILGGAGLKVQELIPLRIENIDLQISCILLGEQKGRMIPFGKRTRECLLKYLYDIRGEVEGPSSLLFPGRGGKMLTRQAVWKIVRKYAAAAEICHPVSPEDLRTSMAVSLLRRGADSSGVQAILGINTASMNKYLQFLQK